MLYKAPCTITVLCKWTEQAIIFLFVFHSVFEDESVKLRQMKLANQVHE